MESGAARRLSCLIKQVCVCVGVCVPSINRTSALSTHLSDKKEDEQTLHEIGGSESAETSRHETQSPRHHRGLLQRPGNVSNEQFASFQKLRKQSYLLKTHPVNNMGTMIM